MSQKTQKAQEIRANIENSIMEKVKVLMNLIVEDQIKLKESQKSKEKDDIDIAVFKQKLEEAFEKKPFEKLAARIQNCQKFQNQNKPQCQTVLKQLQTVFNNLHTQKIQIHIKVNKFIEQFTHDTFVLLEKLHDEVIRLELSGMCGGGQLNRSFMSKFVDFEKVAYVWQHIHQFKSLENDQIYKPQWSEAEVKKYIMKVLVQQIPEDLENKIIEIEVPVEKIVEKIVEKPIYVDKPVYIDNVIEKKVEVQVPREVFKEVQVQKVDNTKEAHEYMFGIGRAQNISKALQMYEQEAKQGNISALNSLGQYYYEGKLVTQSYEKYYEKSSSKDDPEGLYWHGLFLVRGLGCQPSIDQGVSLLEKAAERGNAMSSKMASRMNKRQVITYDAPICLVPPSLEDAESYFTKAKNKGDLRGTCGLALFYLSQPDYVSRFNTKSAFDNALENFKIAKEANYIPAYYHIAQCYEKGMGVEQDIQTAVSFYKHGAFQGDIDCTKSYLLYLLNDNNKDPAQVHHLARQLLVANPNLGIAHYVLGQLYETGRGVQIDFKLAFNHYLDGAKLQEIKCYEKVGDCYYHGIGHTVDYKAGLHYYLLGSQCEDANCMIKAAAILEKGTYQVSKNLSEAEKLYYKAAELNHSEAYIRLAELIQQGQCKSQSQNQVQQFYEKAAQLGSEKAKKELMRQAFSVEKSGKNQKESQVVNFENDDEKEELINMQGTVWKE